MVGPGVPGKNGGPTTVLVFEYVTGGGLIGRELPRSWATEGAAMRRAIAGDFAGVGSGVRVLMTLDSRLPPEDLPGVEVLVIGESSTQGFASIATQADYTVLIAPETDGILAGLAGLLDEVGGRRSLGSSRRGIEFVGDKTRVAHHFDGVNIPTPTTRTLWQGSKDWPADWDGPILVKPRWGAGAVDTVVVRDGHCPPWVTPDPTYLAQPYLAGQPMSASFLVDAEGESTLLAVGRQRVEVTANGRLSYQGGTIPAVGNPCPLAVKAALGSVTADDSTARLRGFVGVDFLLDEVGRAVILEINPRPTTSYVGLARLWPAGTIAGAWLAAHHGALAQTDWPDRLQLAHDWPVITFLSDGSIVPKETLR